MSGKEEVAARDSNAERWRWISIYGFWLCRPEALSAEFPGRPEGLEVLAGRFRRSGDELHVLEYDLTECLNEFKQAYQVLYRDSDRLALKKFAVVYHTDNFYVRVHKLIENVYRLLALVVGLDHTKRPTPGELPQREQVSNGLHRQNLQAVVQALRAFEGNQWVRQAVEVRNAFVHRYRDEHESEWRWSMLVPVSRLREFEDDGDTMGRELREMAEPRHLNNYADQKVEELFETLNVVRDFRDTCYDVFGREVCTLLSKLPAEAKQRFESIRVLHDPDYDVWRER